MKTEIDVWEAMWGIQEVNNAGRIDQLNSMRFKMRSGKHNLYRRKSSDISENEVPCIRKEIPKGGTYNKYGEADRGIEIEAIWETWGMLRNSFFGNPGGRALNRRKICLRHGNKPICACRIKTGAYFDENRKFDARFRVKCFHEFAETNASAPTVQLQRIRVALAVFAYRKWNSRTMDVPRAFPRS